MKDVCANERIILKWLLRKQDMGWIHLVHDRIVTGYYKYYNKSLGSKNVENILTSYETARLSIRTLLNGVGG